MDDLNIQCVFCRKYFERDGVVVKRGLKKIIESSLKRNDGIHEKLEGKTEIRVHSECRHNYTRDTSIKAAVAARKHEDISWGASTSSTALRSTCQKFDFITNCFICGNKALVDLKTVLHRRENVHKVETLKMKQSFLKKCDDRNDDWGERVKARLLSVSDLVAAEARYHRNCFRDFSRTATCQGYVGRPKSTERDSFLRLCEYIETSDECQYTVKEIQDIMKRISSQEDTYTEKHLKNLLLEHFKDRLIISNVSGKKNVICLSDTAHKIIDQWYRKREIDPLIERQRIVLAAADIIKEDIQKMTYDTDSYQDLDVIKSGGENLVPHSLKIFMEQVTKKKNTTESQNVSRKRIVINHAIISAVRPRSFLSPIQTSLALTLHRLYGSRHLLDMLSSMGVCSSYHEASIYITSLINAGLPSVNNEGFIQHVFDNADVNVRTLDGLNTFHAMGGIQCISPGTSVETDIKVSRIRDGSFSPDCIKMCSYAKRRHKGDLSNVEIEHYDEIKKAITLKSPLDIDIFSLNIIWLGGLQQQPGWHGFMYNLTNNESSCESTYIKAVPFINMDPTNMSTIYTALSFAAEQSRLQKQTCIVTFDQPLFLKASEIVTNAEMNSDIGKIVVRLGGFHLLMSFMGSIGRIMEGSGLEKLWETVYGESTVVHMMSGHAYARCVRAYTLTASSLMNIIKESYPDIDVHLESIKDKYNQVSQESSLEEVCNDSLIIEVADKIDESLIQISLTSRTAKLWINLLKNINLILQFIFAERSGNWNMHLNTVIKMLPYFHAAGHLPYAKSAHLYVQQMLKLESKLTKNEFDLFTNKGYFTVRRKGKFWSGTWTDMSIEQCLMRPMKAVGGLTHGRGITDSTLTKWILGTPFFLKVHEAIEDFLGLSITFTEQHAELRESRKIRDQSDIETFTTWLKQHNPFTKLSGELVSLSSGFVSDESVTCDRAYEVGLAAMEKMKGKTFGELKLQRKDMVKNQAIQKSMKIRSKEVIVNPQQVFNRILCVCDSPGNLKKYLEYELASPPPSIFDDFSLRKGTKASLMKVFEAGIVEDEEYANAAIVIDGGFLLHYVPWPKGCSYGEIAQHYYNFILSKYGKNVTVVFDGYPEELSTKQEEQKRRAGMKISCDINFQDNTRCMTAQDEFLNNKINKKRLVFSVAAQLEKNSITAVIAKEDADLDIVRKGLDLLNNNSSVVVVGSDTDLLVLLVALSPENGNVYFSKIKGGKSPSSVCYSINKLVNIYKENRTLLLFAHAMTGCDTTSSFFGLGKVKAVELLKSSVAESQARKFTEPGISPEQLFDVGEKFILALYGMSKYSTLNEARYFRFLSLTRKSLLKSNFNLARLPPTSDAAYQHILRVYFQTQTWLGNKLLPTNWGWKAVYIEEKKDKKRVLKPITATTPFAPDELLRLVSCACKSACGSYCSCRKSGLHCSAMCEHCNGLSCVNSLVLNEDFDIAYDE